ncbi:MAG: hypothetical protein PVG27_00505 [Chloroflexota bacterium]|jgi:hypothetical protein
MSARPATPQLIDRGRAVGIGGRLIGDADLAGVTARTRQVSALVSARAGWG